MIRARNCIPCCVNQLDDEWENGVAINCVCGADLWQKRLELNFEFWWVQGESKGRKTKKVDQEI